MKMKGFVLSLLVLTVVFVACKDSPYPGYKEAEQGFYYKFHRQSKQGSRADSGDRVSVMMRWRSQTDTVYESEDKPGLDLVEMTQPGQAMSLYHVLKRMRKDDSATFILPVDSFFGEQKPPELDTIENFYMDICVKGIQDMDAYRAKREKEQKEEIAREQKKINKYLKENKIQADSTSKGIYVYNRKQSTGESVDTGKVVELEVDGRLLNGDTWLRTSKVMYLVGESPDYSIKWDEVLTDMNKGGSATLLIPSAQAFGESGYMNRVPPYASIIMDVKVMEVLSMEEYQEQELAKRKAKRKESEEKLDAFIRENNITTEPLESGLIYITIQEGKGPQPQKGDTAMVHYKGSFLSGEVFESSYQIGRPLPVVVGQQKLIKGWLEAIPKMQEGEKARIIVPWRLAYGPKGKGEIPPYANLVFELELVNIK